MVTKRTGLQHQRPSKNSPESRAAKAAADARAKTQAELLLDSALGEDRLNVKGRRIALEMVRSITAPTMSDLRLIVLLGQAVDEHTRLLRQVPRPSQAALHASVQLQRSLIRDLGCRSRDSALFSVAYDPETPAPHHGDKPTGDNVVNWALEAQKLGIR